MRSRIRISTSDEWIRIREAQKHPDPVPDSDPQHCWKLVHDPDPGFVRAVLACLNPDPDPSPLTQLNPDPDPKHCYEKTFEKRHLK